MQSEEQLKKQILELTRDYYDIRHKRRESFRDGDRISYSGRVFDSGELMRLIDSALEFWLTSGRYTVEFEHALKRFLGIKYCSLVNSGSSANLLAFMALTSEELGDRRIKRGDEVITTAVAFPTTISPIILYGAVPVFADITIPQYNIDVSRLEAALSDRTKAVILAHTLGNPFNLQYVREFCDRHKLWLVEDNCDALGSMYCLNREWVKTGTVGDMATSSFYPPHHITMGEGGAVYTDNPLLHKLVNSCRDWGRDCICGTGEDNTCRKRFLGRFGELPEGYDHKYVYSHFGFNLKATDMQAAIGCAQMEKLKGFIEMRRRNWDILYSELETVRDVLILPEPEENSIPSWFGFIITVKEEAAFTRNELAVYLESRNIQTRNLFAGNILKQPCFDSMRNSGYGFRVSGTLDNTDRVMNSSLWLGVYPGLNEEMIRYMAKCIRDFIN
jgi:CDP-6-deoxy-D-xylo-4-hexulose-3-dehydrase